MGRVNLSPTEKIQLKTKGFVVQVDKIPGKRCSYWKPDGEELPNLPCDSASMKAYLARGFTLVPPQNMPDAKQTAGRKRGRPKKHSVVGGN